MRRARSRDRNQFLADDHFLARHLEKHCLRLSSRGHSSRAGSVTIATTEACPNAAIVSGDIIFLMLALVKLKFCTSYSGCQSDFLSKSNILQTSHGPTESSINQVLHAKEQHRNQHEPVSPDTATTLSLHHFMFKMSPNTILSLMA